jgi:hypothetical protein
MMSESSANSGPSACETDEAGALAQSGSIPDAPGPAPSIPASAQRQVTREDASYRRRSMEQRRNIEISVFGALITAQIALIALAASNAEKSTSHVVSWFVAITGVTLFATYTAMIAALEARNRADRWAYEHWELHRADPESFWETCRRAWAAWPIVGGAVITGALVWGAIELSRMTIR